MKNVRSPRGDFFDSHCRNTLTHSLTHLLYTPLGHADIGAQIVENKCSLPYVIFE